MLASKEPEKFGATVPLMVLWPQARITILIPLMQVSENTLVESTVAPGTADPSTVTSSTADPSTVIPSPADLSTVTKSGDDTTTEDSQTIGVKQKVSKRSNFRPSNSTEFAWIKQQMKQLSDERSKKNLKLLQGHKGYQSISEILFHSLYVKVQTLYCQSIKAACRALYIIVC